MTTRRVMNAAEVRPGAATVVPIPEGTPPRRSLLVVDTPAGLRGYWNVCRHVPIPLDGGMGTLPPGPELVCVTHGAAYRAEDGVCTRGPCVGKALEPVRVWVEDGALFAEL
jgi:nitrite reductase/ring-hydroxylating ferredoxin subunit